MSAESAVLYLFLILVILAASLIVVLWGGTFFFQGYIYTEPSPGIYWQAPATGVMLTIGYGIWCVTIVLSRGPSTNLPIDTLFRFSPVEDMLDRPAPRLWAIKASKKKGEEKKDGERVAYVSKRDNQTQFHYQDTSVKPARWSGNDVIAIEIGNYDGTTMRFNLVPTAEGDMRHYVSPEGWTIAESPQDGPTGMPTRFRMNRLIMNILYNVAHFFAWFLGLWLILRFQWGHAIGFAIVMWIVMTLTILPMMLSYSGDVAMERYAVKTVKT